MQRLVLSVVALAACSHPAPPPMRDRVGPADEQFKQLARRVGIASRHQLSAWGTVRLDATPRTYRFATMEPTDADGLGIYLVADDGGQTWLLRFRHDGRTHAFGDRDLGTGVTEPPWQFQPELGLRHEQGHHHGGEQIVVGLSAGSLVVFDHHYVDDSTTHAPPVADHFATAGTCASPCPALASFPSTESNLSVVGPFAGPDELLAAAAR